MIGVKNDFLKEVGNEASMFAGEFVTHVYMQAEINMKPGGKAKYEEYCKRYNDFYLGLDPPRGDKYKPEPHVRFYAHDDKIVAKFCLIFSNELSPLK
jgi:hypothetical protein